uniref:Uncharacterized protein n=1 Tax=Anguilla anguilla TaxID=7936 RepID=A0A0E9PEA0_ANGAN
MVIPDPASGVHWCLKQHVQSESHGANNMLEHIAL